MRNSTSCTKRKKSFFLFVNDSDLVRISHFSNYILYAIPIYLYMNEWFWNLVNINTRTKIL